MNYGKKYWGPLAWYLLHSFSLNNNKKIKKEYKHYYYVFYTSFVYILPCFECTQHYTNIVYNINKLEENKIDNYYLKRWVFDVHNIVNGLLNKNKFKYNDLKVYKILNHDKIFYACKILLLNIDYKNIPLITYDQIYNFFVNFCKLYPNKTIRKNLRNVLRTNHFLKINTPLEFSIWLKDYIFD
jgi:hypothetical protein